jgi:hypothetical protein
MQLVVVEVCASRIDLLLLAADALAAYPTNASTVSRTVKARTSASADCKPGETE